MSDAGFLSRPPARAGASSHFDAIVFDLDGVICDTERVIHDIWSETFARFGCTFTAEEWSSVVGTDRAEFDPLEALLSRSTVALPERDEVDQLIEARVERAVCQLAPLPGVLEWISGAEGLGLSVAVASSSPRAWVERRLEGTGVAGRVQVVSCRDDRLRAKPEPDVYLDACERLAVEPARAVAIEDSTNGISAAVVAGLHCIAVRNDNGHVLDASQADLVLASLAAMDIVTALERLASS